MLDPLIIHELIFGEVDFPERMSSDISKLAWYARENNVSMEDLRIALENFKNRYEARTGEAKREYGWAIEIWAKTAEKAIEAAKKTQENLPILDTKLHGPNDKEYAAALSLETGKFAGVDNPGGRYWISVYQPFVDDEQGSTTGIPNAPYWSGTPASYPALDVLDWDHDRITIDGGQNWYVTGVSEMIEELEEKYGDEIRKHDSAASEKRYREREESFNRIVNNESFRAKKVYEALEDVLLPKSTEDVQKEIKSMDPQERFWTFHGEHSGQIKDQFSSMKDNELLSFLPDDVKTELRNAVNDLTTKFGLTAQIQRNKNELWFEVIIQELRNKFAPFYLHEGSFEYQGGFTQNHEGWGVYIKPDSMEGIEDSNTVQVFDDAYEVLGLTWDEVLKYLEDFLKR